MRQECGRIVLFDRFLHHAPVIAITGKSYRVKEAPAVSPRKKKNESPTNLRPPRPRAKLAVRTQLDYPAAGS
jgi:hypothetical protein